MWDEEYQKYRRVHRRRALFSVLIVFGILALPTWFALQVFYDNSDRDLLAAVRRGDLPAVEYALTIGANPNATTRQGRSALHEAAWHGHTRIARALISARADVNARDRRAGETPLHSAARANRPDMAIVLLSAGARSGLRTLEESAPDIRGNRHPGGLTAREIAAAAGFGEVERALRGE